MKIPTRLHHNAYVTRELLLRFGYACTVVANGQEAVHAFEVNDYDLILMDIQMPIMDGIAMSRAIRQLSPETHIIAVTAHSDTGFLLIGRQILSEPVQLSSMALGLALYLHALERRSLPRNALAGFILGAGIGIARSSPIPAPPNAGTTSASCSWSKAAGTRRNPPSARPWTERATKS